MVYSILTKMKLTLKKYFIPHKGNDHKPHILRWEATIVILSAILLIETLFFAQVFLIGKNTNFLAAVISNVIVDKTNAERIDIDLSSLATNDLLELAAQLKANDMAKKGYFAHETPEGYDPWYWLEQSGYNFAAAGENLAVNFTDSEDVVSAWMDSDGHRANILKNNFTQIGVATAKGEYKGRETIFVVQFFGTPSVAVAKTEPLIPPAPNGIEEEPNPNLQPQESEQIKEPIVKEEAFIQTEDIDITLALNTAGSTADRQQSSLIQKIASEPKTTTNYMLIMLATIIAVALALKLFINVKVQHPPLIVNGVLLLLIMSSTILVNQYLSTIGASIS